LPATLARANDTSISEAVRTRGAVPVGQGATTDDWFKSFAHKEGLGFSTVQRCAEAIRSGFPRWSARKEPRAIEADDLENIVQPLDGAVADWRRRGGKSGARNRRCKPIDSFGYFATPNGF
jgi:hypothetical protein